MARCWAHEPDERPPFAEIARTLAASRFGSLGSVGAVAVEGGEGGHQHQQQQQQQQPLLSATLLRLTGGAWRERRVELSRGGVLCVFDKERRETHADLADVCIALVADPTAAQIAEAAAEAEEEKEEEKEKGEVEEAMPPRKPTVGGSRRRASTSAAPPLPPSHRFVFLVSCCALPLPLPCCPFPPHPSLAHTD